MANTIFSAKVTAKQGLTMECTSREFTIAMDEPAVLGGNNTGMNPVEALLNALGACKAIVARSFAQMKGFNFTELTIELDGTLDPDGFMGMNPEAKIGLSHIHTRYIFVWRGKTFLETAAAKWEIIMMTTTVFCTERSYRFITGNTTKHIFTGILRSIGITGTVRK